MGFVFCHFFMLSRLVGRSVTRDAVIKQVAKLPKAIRSVKDGISLMKELHRLNITHRPALVALEEVMRKEHLENLDQAVWIDYAKICKKERGGSLKLPNPEIDSVTDKVAFYESQVMLERFDGLNKFGVDTAQITYEAARVAFVYAMTLHHFVRPEQVDTNVYLQSLSNVIKGSSQLSSNQQQRRLLQIRCYLRYMRRDMYNKLDQDTRDAWTVLAMNRRPLLRPPVKHRLTAKVAECLGRLKVALAETDAPCVGPFRVDIKERDRRIVYQCDGPERFIHSNSNEKLLKYRFQEEVIKSMGYRVVSVPHWHLERIRLKKTRIEYLRMSRYRAINDLRERASQAKVNSYELNDSFDAKAAAFQHVGEVFFKPERTNRPWAWTRHRLVGDLPTRVSL
jgi:hypothetical protein